MYLSEGLRKNPFLRILIPFIIAILAGATFKSILLPHFSFIILISLITISTFVITLFFKLQLKLTDFLITIIVFILSLMHTLIFIHSDSEMNDIKEYRAIVTNSPEFKSNSVLIVVKLNMIEKPTLFAPRLYLYTQKDSAVLQKVNAGDQIVFKAKLNPVKNFGNPDEFDYSSYLISRGVFYQTYVPYDSFKIIKKPEKKFQFISYLNKVRSFVIQTIDSSIENDDVKGIIRALIIGDKSGVTYELKNKYANAGVIHVLAISGLHVGILYMFLFFLLKPLETGRLQYLRFLIIGLIIWSYALLTGFSPSVSRAATMFTLLSLGKSINREISNVNLLAASAFILLIINPFSLFDVGFQLSYAAVTGIILFQPVFYNFYTMPNKLLDYFYKLFTVSLAAQIMTIPLTIYYFNKFPIWFWFSNLIIIPLIFVVIILCVLLLITSKILVLNIIFGTLIQWSVLFINYFISSINLLPVSVLKELYLSVIEVIFLYSIIFLTFFRLTLKHKKLVVPLLLGCLFFIGANLVDTTLKLKEEKIIIYNTNNDLNIGFYLKNKNLLYTTNFSLVSKNIDYYYNKHWLRMKRRHVDIIPFDSVKTSNTIEKNVNDNFEILVNKDIRIWLNYDKTISEIDFGNKRDDYIIICENVKPPGKSLSDVKLILTATLDYNYAKLWHNYAQKNDLKCYDISKNGAYEIEL